MHININLSLDLSFYNLTMYLGKDLSFMLWLQPNFCLAWHMHTSMIIHLCPHSSKESVFYVALLLT